MPAAANATPKVSVIIPSYKTAHLIARCLDSVMAQTFQDFEAIVVNDGSPDTPELEKALQPYMDRIVYIKQENKRCAGARNTAIRHARGQFLAFLDSDDTWYPEHLASQMQQFADDPSLDLVYCDSLLVGDPTRESRFMERCPSNGPATFGALIVERCQIPISTVVARKRAIVNAGCFDEKLLRCDDYDMWVRTAFSGAKIGYIRKLAGHMYIGRPGSMSQEKSKMVEAYWSILEKFKSLPLKDADRAVVEKRAAAIRARYLVEEGKRRLGERQVDKARELFTEANRNLKDPRLSAVLFGLKIAPNVTGKLVSMWSRLLSSVSLANFSGHAWCEGRENSVLRRAIVEAKRVFGLHSPGRNLAVFPDDTFLVSFPKSGNTWARFLIANLVRPNQKIDFSNVNRVIPGPEVTRNRDLMRIPRPRIIKSHQYFDPRYRRVIYIVRDPRDVVVSQYHFQRKRLLVADQFPLSEFVGRFLAGQTCFYGSWGEHVASWLATRHGQPGFLLLRYEDMVENTARELTKIASFLGLTATPELIKQAVERSSVDTMRQLEKSQAQLFTATKDTRQDIPFVRAAKAGGWRSALSEESARQIEEVWGHLIKWLGYEMISAETATRFEDRAGRNQPDDFLVGPRP